MQNIDNYILNVITTEGGYVNNPADKGGETNHGITKAVALANGYTGAMIDLTTEQASTIYKVEYWLKPNFDEIFKVDNQLAFMLFQFGVLSGVVTSAMMLQRALNVLYKQSLIIDGKLGETTLNALNAFKISRNDNPIHVLRGMVMAQQSVYLIECAEHNPNDKQFEYGWQLNRVISVGF